VIARAIHTPSKASAGNSLSLAKSALNNVRTFSQGASLSPASQKIDNPEDEDVSWPKALAWVAAAAVSWYAIIKYTKEAFHFPTGMLNENPPTPPHWHWPQAGWFGSYDHASLRRGYDVYRQVCSQCHSLNGLAFRQLVGVTHTEQQAKELASTIQVKDGFDENGDDTKRPGTLLDYMPNPYKNEAQARGANGGALPPDLTRITETDHHGKDYIMSLLTGYNDVPAGVKQQDGKHWNTYFDGGWISMPPPLLVDEQVEYEDGTPATKSQMAKDVTHFLTWVNYKGHDDNKAFGLFVLTSLAILTAFNVGARRHRYLADQKAFLHYLKPKPQKH